MVDTTTSDEILEKEAMLFLLLHLFTFQNTPYSKVAANILFFCLHVNQPFSSRQHVLKKKEF